MTFKPDYRQPALKTFKLVWAVVVFSLTATVTYKLRVPNLSYSTMKITTAIFIIITLWIYIFFQFERRNTFFLLKDGCLTEIRHGIFETERKVKTSEIINIQIEQSVFERALKLYHIKFKIKTTVIFGEFNFIINENTAKKILPQIQINSREHIKTMRFSFLRVLRHSFLTSSPQMIITAVMSIFLLAVFRENAVFLFGIGVVGAVITTLRALYIVFKTAFLNFNFRLDIYDNSINLQKGLIFKKTQSLNKNGICAYTIVQPLLARIFKFGYLKAVGVENKTICLCVKINRIYNLLPKENFNRTFQTGIFKMLYLSENYIKIEKGILKKQIVFIRRNSVESSDFISLPKFRYHKIKIYSDVLHSNVHIGFIRSKNT